MGDQFIDAEAPNATLSGAPPGMYDMKPSGNPRVRSSDS
jgi:hypothetical protein